MAEAAALLAVVACAPPVADVAALLGAAEPVVAAVALADVADAVADAVVVEGVAPVAAEEAAVCALVVGVPLAAALLVAAPLVLPVDVAPPAEAARPVEAALLAVELEPLDEQALSRSSRSGSTNRGHADERWRVGLRTMLPRSVPAATPLARAKVVPRVVGPR